MKGSVGEWSELAHPGKRDRAAIGRAEAAREAFLKAFPDGRYAASARNFERRIAWLRGDQATLGAAYSSLLARKAAAGGPPDSQTMEEVDRRILPSSDAAGITDPTLLAVTDLMRLRPTPEYDKRRSCCGAELGREELGQQRPAFVGQPDLYAYLLAADMSSTAKSAGARRASSRFARPLRTRVGRGCGWRSGPTRSTGLPEPPRQSRGGSTAGRARAIAWPGSRSTSTRAPGSSVTMSYSFATSAPRFRAATLYRSPASWIGAPTATRAR